MNRESGSTYILSLLVLLLVSGLGLALSFLTGTERQLSHNERFLHEVFYAADGGSDVAVARVLASGDHSEDLITLERASHIEQRLFLGPALPLVEAPCNLCEINATGGYGDDFDYRRSHLAVLAVGARVSPVDGQIHARRAISSTVDIQPWQLPPQAFDSLWIYDGAEEVLAEKVRF